MYQDIYRYAKKKNLTTEKNRRKVTVAAYINLTFEGKYSGCEIIPKTDRYEIKVPDAGNYYSSGMATPVCDKKDTIFGSKKHDSWISLTKEGSQYCDNFNPLLVFMELIDNNDSYKQTVLEDLKSVKDTEFIAFRIDDQNLEKDPSWCEWFDAMMEKKMASTTNDTKIGISCMSGEASELVTTSLPILRDSKSYGTGISLFSNSHKLQSGPACAFVSYGAGKEACAMSMEDIDTISAALSHLFNSGHNHSKDFNILYYYDDYEDELPDIVTSVIRRHGKDEKAEKRYQELLTSIMSGKMSVELSKDKMQSSYHIIRYCIPDKGRFSITRQQSGTYEELYTNLRQWYEDAGIDMGGQKRTLSNVYSIMLGLLHHKKVDDKFKEVDAEFGPAKQALLDSVFAKKQIPRIIYTHALEQVVRSMIYDYYQTDDNEIKTYYSPWTALMIIKTYLIREGINMSATLDTENKNPGYLCGRWLATMDRLQQESASGKVGTPIGQKLYKGCTKNPAKVLNLCSENKGVYLNRLSTSLGRKIYFERLFDEIAAKFDSGTFPEKFSVTDEGAFHLGYAMQNQDFYKKKDNVSDNVNMISTEEN